tara:strand:+ start:3877 stop:4533 length:657 start_codon:yes stop_codon:yes gene_type:complete
MNCPLCGARAKLFWTGENREYELCGKCGLIFVPPSFHLTKKSEIERYQEHENSLDNKGYVTMFINKITLVKNHCPKIKTALDFGCGYEPVLQTLLNNEGIETEIYDPNFFPVFPSDKTFDLVISTETFEHFRKPGTDIKIALNSISPSGVLAVMTRFYPLKQNKPCKKSFSEWYYQRDPTHIAFYTSKTFKWMSKNFSLSILLDNEFDFVLFKKSLAK